jgi:hypothetical protein
MGDVRKPCPHLRTFLREDIGWDIDTEGEERQHTETCLDCRAWRFVFDVQPFFGEEHREFGKWQEPEEHPHD